MVRVKRVRASRIGQRCWSKPIRRALMHQARSGAGIKEKKELRVPRKREKERFAGAKEGREREICGCQGMERKIDLRVSKKRHACGRNTNSYMFNIVCFVDPHFKHTNRRTPELGVPPNLG